MLTGPSVLGGNDGMPWDGTSGLGVCGASRFRSGSAGPLGGSRRVCAISDRKEEGW